MGTNRRYEKHYDDKWRQQQLRDDPQPFPASLSREEVDPDHFPIATPEFPIPVTAWVTLVMPETGVRVEAEARSWNAKAVEIVWKDKYGNRYRSWVWASAVERL